MGLKSEILSRLERQRAEFGNEPISGQEMAAEFSVSRAAVWKAIQSLEAQGHGIAATPNRGYRLEQESDVLSQEGIRLYLSKVRQDMPVLVYQSVDSTNTVAKRLAVEGAVHGTVVVADQQTGGRGRLGRVFYSPSGSGVYLSILLRPKGLMVSTQGITVAAAVAVCRALERTTGKKAQIKWVNDIFLGGRKVGGILTEAVSDVNSGVVDSLVVGIGLNVKAPEEGFPLELQGVAGSVFEGQGGAIRNRLVGEMVNELMELSGSLQNRGEYMGEYRERSLVLGRVVRYSVLGQTVREGKAVGIDDDGGLLVQGPDGELTALQWGEVSLSSASLTE